MKLNLKLNDSDFFYSHRNIRLCAEEVQRIFGIEEDVQEVTLTVSRKRFIGSMRATVYCHKGSVPFVKLDGGETQQILLETFRAIASRVGIKVNDNPYSYTLTPRVVYVRITAK